MCFLSATLLKVVSGGWFTLSVAVILCSVMMLWKWGTTRKIEFELSHKTKLGDIFDGKTLNGHGNRLEEDDGEIDELTRPQLRLLDTKFPVNRLPGIGLFYREAGMGVPLSFSHFVEHFPSLPEIVVFITIRPVAVPIVGEEDRLVVQKIGNYEGMYQAIARYGYMEAVDQGDQFISRLVNAISISDPTKTSIRNNEKEVITYVISQPSFISRENSPWWRNVFIAWYRFIATNSRQIHGTWHIPVDDLIDVGMKVPL
ncbi:4369_t:CDS:1 [Acaulospora colombiana]|uniref:4369_t:CDS:1 n=1 Tax=Acaulospora colombiana TaxID=27376 RepID=A0ACA9LYT6_9GLOM|nr:4369_t:CDS:1 [Acaulospora colombiana]